MKERRLVNPASTVRPDGFVILRFSAFVIVRSFDFGSGRAGVASLVRPAEFVVTFIIKVNTFMGRPPGRIQDRPFQMRLSNEFLKRLDDGA